MLDERGASSWVSASEVLAPSPRSEPTQNEPPVSEQSVSASVLSSIADNDCAEGVSAAATMYATVAG